MCMCLQGSSRSGQQFDVTVETFTGSHQQKKYMLFTVKWTQIISSRGERNACHFTFSSSLDHFTEGGQSGSFSCKERHQYFYSHCFFLSICDPNLCPYMLQTPFKLYSLNSQVAIASSICSLLFA